MVCAGARCAQQRHVAPRQEHPRHSGAAHQGGPEDRRCGDGPALRDGFRALLCAVLAASRAALGWVDPHADPLHLDPVLVAGEWARGFRQRLCGAHHLASGRGNRRGRHLAGGHIAAVRLFPQAPARSGDGHDRGVDRGWPWALQCHRRRRGELLGYALSHGGRGAARLARLAIRLPRRFGAGPAARYPALVPQGAPARRDGRHRDAARSRAVQGELHAAWIGDAGRQFPHARGARCDRAQLDGQLRFHCGGGRCHDGHGLPDLVLLAAPRPRFWRRVDQSAPAAMGRDGFRRGRHLQPVAGALAHRPADLRADRALALRDDRDGCRRAADRHQLRRDGLHADLHHDRLWRIPGGDGGQVRHALAPHRRARADDRGAAGGLVRSLHARPGPRLADAVRAWRLAPGRDLDVHGCRCG